MTTTMTYQVAAMLFQNSDQFTCLHHKSSINVTNLQILYCRYGFGGRKEGGAAGGGDAEDEADEEGGGQA